MRGSLVRRLLEICAVAVAVCAALTLFARAQSGTPIRAVVVTDQDYPRWVFYKDLAALPRSPLTVADYGPPRAVAVGTSGTPKAFAFFGLVDWPDTIGAIVKEIQQSATGEVTEVDYVPRPVAGEFEGGF